MKSNKLAELICSKEQIKRNSIANFSEALKLLKLGITWIEIPPGEQSSHPQFQNLKEEFILVVKGHPHAELNHNIYPLNPGNIVGLNNLKTDYHFKNNTTETIELIVLGKKSKASPLLKTEGLKGKPEIRDWKDLDFIKDLSDLQRKGSFSYAGDAETFPQGIRMTDHLGLKFLGLWHEVLPSGKRTSWPHAHKHEEEFALILKGNPKVWLSGHVFDLKPGDGVYFPPGSNISHTLFNEGAVDVEYIGIGYADDAGTEERIYYPLHEDRNEENKIKGWLWENPPQPASFGFHPGIPAISDIQVELVDSSENFLKIISQDLYQKEAEYSLLLGLAEMNSQKQKNIIVKEKNKFIGAGLVSAQNLVISAMPEAHLKYLAEFLNAQAIQLPGVVGPAQASESFARAWRRETKSHFRMGMAQKIYKLEKMIPPQNVKGSLSLAMPEHAELVSKWIMEFTQECLPHQLSTLEKYREMMEAKIKKSEVYLWLDEAGKPASMCLVGRPTKNGISVSGVYTPPNLRKKGYASGVTGYASQEMLNSGKKFCVLYTDLANPTSNKIYQNIGYAEVARSKHFLFVK